MPRSNPKPQRGFLDGPPSRFELVRQDHPDRDISRKFPGEKGLRTVFISSSGHGSRLGNSPVAASFQLAGESPASWKLAATGLLPESAPY